MQIFIYCQMTLHVQGVNRARHQECIKLQLKPLIQIGWCQSQQSTYFVVPYGCVSSVRLLLDVSKLMDHICLFVIDKFYIRGSVHRNSKLKKSNYMQLYADIYLLLNYCTCFGRPSRPRHQKYIKLQLQPLVQIGCCQSPQSIFLIMCICILIDRSLFCYFYLVLFSSDTSYLCTNHLHVKSLECIFKISYCRQSILVRPKKLHFISDVQYIQKLAANQIHMPRSSDFSNLVYVCPCVVV